MIKMRKLLALSMAFAMVLSLAACGSSAPESTGDAAEEAQEESSGDEAAEAEEESVKEAEEAKE